MNENKNEQNTGTKTIKKIGYQERLLFTVKYKRVILNNFVSSR